MIAPDPASNPPSNRGGKTDCQKTNLQPEPVRVLIDRLRLASWVTPKIDPEDLLRTIFGFVAYKPRRVNRGNRTVTLHQAFDSPSGTPGGVYYAMEPSRGPAGSYLLTVEFNPQKTLQAIQSRLRSWLTACGCPYESMYVDRVDLAFDYLESRDSFTVIAAPRRKANLWVAGGSGVETIKYAHTDDRVGATCYDKRKEILDNSDEELAHDLTRYELRIHPHKHLEDYRPNPDALQRSFRMTDLQNLDLPETLGNKLIYMPYPEETHDLDQRDSEYYAACRVVAEYDPLRARKMIIDHAMRVANQHGRTTTREHAEMMANTLMQTVDLGTTWRDRRGQVWRQISQQSNVPGTRPQIAVSET